MGNEPTIVENNTPTPGVEGGDNAGKVFTQDDVDKIIKKRLGEDSERVKKSILGDIGVESIDDIKSIIKAKQDAEEAEKTELDKATETITTLNSTLEELQGKLSSVEADKKLASLAAQHGIKEVDYFKFEYEKASKADDFDESTFISNLLETKGSLLKADTSATVSNPKVVNNNTNQATITMSEYSVLPAAERAKYKPNQIIKG
jgi:hypothetical protein